MSWQILLAISVLTYSISVILQRILLKDNKSDPVAYMIVFQILTGSLIGIYALMKGFTLPNISQNFINLILMTVFYSAAPVLIFKSLKLIEASTFTIFFTTRAFWTIIASIIILKESFSLGQTIGAILIFISVILVSLKDKSIKFRKGEFFALLAAILFGVAFVNDAIILKQADIPSYLTLAFIIPGFVIWALYPRSTYKMKVFLERKTFVKMLLLGIFYAVSGITVFQAYQLGQNAAQIAPLNQTSTILTIIIAIIFLKERDIILRKIIGAVLSFIGVILLK